MKKYQIIYADPPWRQSKGGIRKSRPNQKRVLDYSTISLEDIENYIASFSSGAHTLFLWTIDKYLHEAEQIGVRLGFKLHARLVWNKMNGVAPAFTVRFGHEYLLWMYRSPMHPISSSARGKFLTVFNEKATRHSKKPKIAYTIIEQLYPDAKKLELFARQKTEGWDVWGNEVESDIVL